MNSKIYLSAVVSPCSVDKVKRECQNEKSSTASFWGQTKEEKRWNFDEVCTSFRRKCNLCGNGTQNCIQRIFFGDEENGTWDDGFRRFVARSAYCDLMKLWHLTQSHFSPFVLHLPHRTRQVDGRIWKYLQPGFIFTNKKEIIPGMDDISSIWFCFCGNLRDLCLDIDQPFSPKETLKTQRSPRTKRANWEILAFLSPAIKISAARFSRRRFAD